MKKLLSVLAVLALVGTMAFAQEAEAVAEAAAPAGDAFFQNTVKTDVVKIKSTANGVKVGYDYIWEEMKAGYNSEKLDIFAKGRIKLLQSDGVPTGIGYVADETYFGINYKPVEGLSLGIGQSIVIPGAYLAVEDDDLTYGKLGCPGFDIAYTNWGLTLVASFDFLSGVYNNYFVDAAGNYVFNTRFGGWYEFKADKDDETPVFTIGAAFRYNNGVGASLEANPYHIGAYATFTPKLTNEDAELQFLAGYSYNVDDDLYITGDHAINFSAILSVGDFSCAFDYDTNTDGDFYSGLYLSYTINDFTPDVGFQMSTTYADFANGGFYIWPGCTWKINKHHKVYFGASLSFEGGSWDALSFPCKWVYKL